MDRFHRRRGSPAGRRGDQPVDHDDASVEHDGNADASKAGLSDAGALDAPLGTDFAKPGVRAPTKRYMLAMVRRAADSAPNVPRSAAARPLEFRPVMTTDHSSPGMSWNHLEQLGRAVDIGAAVLGYWTGVSGAPASSVVLAELAGGVLP